MSTPLPKTYALLVGIDDYPAPVSKLNGCKKDVDRIRQYLLQHFGATAAPQSTTTDQQLEIENYGSLALCVLEDQRASYDNILRAFRQHLQQAGPKDVVWFHFSGHGMEDYTAAEFRESIEPNGKDQNLVCYQKNKSEGQLLLADKELAVLLHEVATANDSDQSPHIVVSLDCCHSGSGTREVSFTGNFQERTARLRRPRTWEEAAAVGKVRALDSYLEGYFRRQGFEIPTARHILFSACTSIQTAGDTPEGGIFTAGLIDALTGSGGQLNYADVFVRTRATVRSARKEQLPQFETIGGFDPYTRFLQGTPLGTPDRYELQNAGDDWLVKCGAIHGLPVRPRQPIQVEVLTPAPASTLLGRGSITEVGAQKSKCHLEAGLSLDPDISYQAVIRYLAQPAMQVQLSGNKAALEQLTEQWDESEGVKWIKEGQATPKHEPEYTIEASNGKYFIRDETKNKQVLSIPQQPIGPRVCMDALGKMVRWERTILLDNPKSSIRNRVQFSLDVLLNNHQRKTYQSEELDLVNASTPFLEKDGALFAGFVPKVTITNTSQQLFLYLFHLRSNYSIESYEGEHIFRPFEHPGKTEVTISLLKQPKGWGLSPKEKETFSYFKLLVTTEKLDYFQLLQSGLEGDKSTNWLWAPVGVSDEWCSSTMKVTLKR